MVSFKFEDRDLGFTEFFARIERRGVQLRVGVLGDKAEKDHDGITMGDLAAVHEFGTRRVPQRSYLRGTFDENRKKYQRLMGKAVLKLWILKLLRGKPDFEKLGRTMVDDIRKKVASNIPPRLSEKYAVRKERKWGFRDPALIASGRLMDAISAEVGVLSD